MEVSVVLCVKVSHGKVAILLVDDLHLLLLVSSSYLKLNFVLERMAIHEPSYRHPVPSIRLR